MNNQKLENIVEKVKDFAEDNQFLIGPAIAIAFYGIIAANGFYRGITGMPITPENLSQVTIPDVISATTVGAAEVAITIDGLTTERYSDSARCAAGMIGLPIIGALTHGLGYTAGYGINKLL